MKQKLFRLLIVMTISITVLFALGMTAFADEAGDFIITATNGGALTTDDYTYENNILTIKSNTPVTISGTTTEDSIFIKENIDATITLNGVNIDVSATGELNTGNVDASISGTPALKIADDSTGDVTIILADGSENVLKSGVKCAGLQKNGEYTADLGMLTIKGG